MLQKIVKSETKDKFNTLYDKGISTSNNIKEFEIIFNKLISLENYINIISYLKKINKTEKLLLNQSEKSIDINFKYKEKQYRITIPDKDIPLFYKQNYNIKNNVIIKNLLINPDINLTSKNKLDILIIDEFNIKVRLADEISENNMKNIIATDTININDIVFRYKERITLFVYKKDEYNYVKIDATCVKQVSDLKKINYQYANYEVELESVRTSNKENNIDLIYKYIENILLIIQQSNFLITNKMVDEVIKYYSNILNIKYKITNLQGRQPISLELNHLIDKLPNKYAVTDKADGNRYMMIIYNACVYLIDVNLKVKDTGIVLSDEQANKYNGTLVDGEYIYIKTEDKYIYLIFDCLFYGTKDIRMVAELETRLEHANKIVNNLFTNSKKTTGKPPNIKEYLTNLNKDIASNTTKYPLIRTKNFLFVEGRTENEVYKNATQIWDLYQKSCPYFLDGLIFQPQTQTYTLNKETQDQGGYFDYKWKPPETNSIDFYVVYKKDKLSGKIMNVFNNIENDENDTTVKYYKICNLYVGNNIMGTNNKRTEVPILFNEDQNLHEAYLYSDETYVHDMDGNIILDETVVEFYYLNDETIPEKFRWKPIRTRHDKTEAVRKYKIRYGNNSEVANNVWRSIQNPILIDDFIILSNDKLYENKIKDITNTLGYDKNISKNELKYYQIHGSVKDLVSPMTNFHNLMKSNIIYTYINKTFSDVGNTILDFGCGQGGDLLKFYYGSPKLYVGFDVNKENIISPSNGAISRYTNFKKKYPRWFETVFIQADGGFSLDENTQSRVLSNMTDDNKKLITKYLNGTVKYDRINCQFMIHYLFKTEDTWKNYKLTINKLLEVGGYVFITAFDGKELMKQFDKEGHFKRTYDGKLLFDIKKNYPDKLTSHFGNAVDLFASWMFAEGRYETEYLVDSDFMINDLLKDCGLKLVDTDLFMNQFEKLRDYFTQTYLYESKEETKNFTSKVAKYYNETDINVACYDYSRITRYWIFCKN